MTGRGGATEFHIANPKKIHEPEILDPKNTRLKYPNTDLFNQTELFNAWFCINRLMNIILIHWSQWKACLEMWPQKIREFFKA